MKFVCVKTLYPSLEHKCLYNMTTFEELRFHHHKETMPIMSLKINGKIHKGYSLNVVNFINFIESDKPYFELIISECDEYIRKCNQEEFEHFKLK